MSDLNAQCDTDVPVDLKPPQEALIDTETQEIDILGDTSWVAQFARDSHQTRLTAENLRLVLNSLMRGETVAQAAEEAGISRGTIFDWVNKIPQVKKLYDDAMLHGTEILEGKATKRAIEKSDLLMMFILKSRNPERFREAPSTQITNNISLFNLLTEGLDKPKPAQTIDQAKK